MPRLKSKDRTKISNIIHTLIDPDRAAAPRRHEPSTRKRDRRRGIKIQAPNGRRGARDGVVSARRVEEDVAAKKTWPPRFS